MTKRFRAIALVVALSFLPCAARADVDIEPECRMKNRPPGRCGWCALETLGRHRHIQALSGLVEGHASTANPDDLTALLDKAKVRYNLQQRGDRDTALLRSACTQGLGAAVGFRPLHEGAGGHIVTLVSFGEDTVKVIDPNDQDGRVRTMPRERFLDCWDGFTLVLQPEHTAKK